MKKLMLVLALLAFLSVPVMAQSGPQQQDEKIIVRVSDLPPSMVAELKTKAQLEQMGRYAGLGKEIGQAVNGALTALTSNVDKLGETKVGKFTMFMVAWKVMGLSAIQAAVGIPMMFLGFILFVWTWNRNCMTRTVLSKVLPDKTKVYETIKPDGEVRGAHFLCYIVYCGMCCGIIFLH